MTLALWLVLGACAIGVVTDVAMRKIPNALTFALALAGLGLAATGGWASFGISLALLVGVTLLGLLAFTLKFLGGGDVKLLAACAATVGYPDAVALLLYTAVAGGFLAVIFALVTGRLRTVLASTAAVARPLAYKGTVAEAPRSGLMLPYGIAIAGGAAAVALSHTLLPVLKLPL